MSEIAVGLSGRWDLSNQARPIKQADFGVPSVTGICQNLPEGTEQNRCYTVATNDPNLVARFGEGDLVDQIRAIGRGLPSGKQALNVTVVPVKDSAETDPTAKRDANIAALRGLDDQKTGVYALKHAVAQGALMPRLNTIAGGYDAFIQDNTANPIVTALTAVNASTFGHAFINGPNSTEVEAKAVRSLYSDPSLTMIETGVQITDESNNLETVGASGFVAGLQAAVDAEHDGVPSHVAGNRALRIAAPGREMTFDWMDPSTEGQRLLNAQCDIIVRGRVGGDFSAGEGGMILVTCNTLSSDPLERYYNVVRMQNYILLTLLRSYKVFLLKYNMNPKRAIKAVIKQTNNWLVGMAQREIIYSAPKVLFVPDAETPSDWRKGKLAFTGRAEPRAPLTQIDLSMERDDAGIELEIAELETFAKNLSL
ncbi:hypothetical protein [uncultured Cohaesibacter sp.]|uniref:hypothetical protein n=1 Tax=uncultured Cohaesibacter sp. TaxID=1002546 RepID=UPI002AA92AED|nr:hypothetical protein [uncultured Cohaesibacter sp.]